MIYSYWPITTIEGGFAGMDAEAMSRRIMHMCIGSRIKLLSGVWVKLISTEYMTAMSGKYAGCTIHFSHLLSNPKFIAGLDDRLKVRADKGEICRYCQEGFVNNYWDCGCQRKERHE